MIKAIIFDYGGVISVEPRLRTVGERYAEELGIDGEKLNEDMINIWLKARVDECDSRLFFDTIAKHLKIDRETAKKTITKMFGFRKEILDLAKKLKGRYELGILSNNIREWFEHEIKTHELDSTFNVIVTSYEARSAKPDIKIYEYLLKKIKAKPEECIFIDDLERNLPPAQGLGMKTILFKNVKQLEKDLAQLGIET